MKKRVCFIDDDASEIDLFTRTFSDTFELVAGSTLDQCRRSIEDRWGSPPDLFVLDLYFPYDPPDLDLLQALKRQPASLEADDGDLRRATRNYVAADQRLTNILKALGQTPQAGLDLARRIRSSSDFASVPLVFYSRNPTAEDYIRCMREGGVVDLVPKPTGADDEDTRTVTARQAARIAERFLAAMTPEAVARKSRVAAVAQQALDVLLKPFLEELSKQGAATLYKG